MVKLLNPPTPRTPPQSHSATICCAHEKRLQEEMEQLLVDIRRIGPGEGEPHVLFGELFDDDQAQQYYEALVGTLKSAKKRGYITFKGQMLLKGIHDDVVISIVEGKEGEFASSNGSSSDEPPQTTKTTAEPIETEVNTDPEVTTKKERTVTLPPKQPAPAFTFSPRRQRRSPIVTKEKKDINGSSSDSEACDDPVYGVGTVGSYDYAGTMSDSECDPKPVRSPRRQLVLPSVFLQRQNMKSSPSRRGGEDSDCGTNQPKRPSHPWKVRRAGSTPGTSKSWQTMPRQSLPLRMSDENQKPGGSVPTKTLEQPSEKSKKSAPPPRAPKPRYTRKPPTKTPSMPPTIPQRPTSTTAAAASSRAQSMRNLSTEASNLVDDEVTRLLTDIRRVGSNPGEPNVTFGELFDDEDVQNTYEALVGTLRSAKRRGLIHFQGQMLLKGMHDNVVISVVESK